MTKKGKKLKFVFVTEYFPSKNIIDVQGGVEVRTYYLAKELAKKHSVLVVTSKEFGKPNRQTLNNIKIIRVGLTRRYGYRQKGDFLKRLSFILACLPVCLRFKAHLVEGGFIGQIPTFILAKLRKTVSVAFIADTYYNTGYRFNYFHNILFRIMEKILFNNSWDGYIVISNIIKRKLEEFNILPDKIKVIYCGVNLHEIKKTTSKKTPYPSICAISRLVYYKKVQDIIKSVNILKKFYPQIKCHVIGSGEESKSLKNLVNQLQLTTNIIFHGFVPNHKKVLKILKSCWVYCSASIAEGFGIATVESMAANTPYVIADIPVNREVTMNKGGLFFQPNNYQDLALKLKILLEDRSYARKIISTNPDVVSRYSIESMVKKTEDYYLSLLDSK